MKTPSIFGALCAIAVQAFAAEDSVKFDNDQARVLVASSAPGVRTALHEHTMNRVMIYLDAGTMTLTDPKGKVQTLNFTAGEALWSPAGGLHTSLNTSGRPVRIVEVELKDRPATAPTTKQLELDPVKVDPKRYKVEIENDQVRVLRARYAPHDKGVMHEHSLNRVVTYLTPAKMRVTTPDGEAKTVTAMPGEVTWGAKAKHIEENQSNAPFEVVVVEFKK